MFDYQRIPKGKSYDLVHRRPMYGLATWPSAALMHQEGPTLRQLLRLSWRRRPPGWGQLTGSNGKYMAGWWLVRHPFRYNRGNFMFIWMMTFPISGKVKVMFQTTNQMMRFLCCHKSTMALTFNSCLCGISDIPIR